MTEIDPLTRVVYDYIVEYRRKKGYPPTLREIGRNCHLAHSTVYHQLGILEGMDWINREYNTPRGIRLSNKAPDYQEPDESDDSVTTE